MNQVLSKNNIVVDSIDSNNDVTFAADAIVDVTNAVPPAVAPVLPNVVSDLGLVVEIKSTFFVI